MGYLRGVQPTFSLSPFEPVADRVWRAVAEPASVNIGLVAGASGCLVVDTGSSPAQGRAIRDAAERTADAPLIAAVVTHHHYDHAYGLAAFADVATYAHASVAASVRANPELAAELASLGLDESDLAEANRTFGLAVTIDLGGRHVEAVHFGPGHSPGDVAVLVPDARVVFAGDLLEESGPPQAGPDADLAGWPVALDGILGTLRADSVVVPGHGEPVDRIFAVDQRGQLAGVYLQLEYLFASGATLDDVIGKGDWPFPPAAFEAVVPAVYAQLKAKGKVGRPLKVIH